MNMKKGNYIVSAVCAVLGIAIITIASGYPTAADYGTGVPGPGLWPISISAVMLLCAALLMAQTLKMPEEENEEIELWTPNTRRVYISMLILAIYCIVLQPVGYIISTTVMQFVFIQWFGKKKPYITLLIALVITLVSYFAFKNLLNVPVDFGMFAL